METCQVPPVHMACEPPQPAVPQTRPSSLHGFPSVAVAQAAGVQLHAVRCAPGGGGTPEHTKWQAQTEPSA